MAGIVAVVASGVLLTSCTSGGTPQLELAAASITEEDIAASAGNAFLDEQGEPTVLSDGAADSAPDNAIVAPSGVSAATETSEAEQAAKNEDIAASQPPAPSEPGLIQDETIKLAARDTKSEKKRRFLSSLWSANPSAGTAATNNSDRRLAIAAASPVLKKKPVKQTNRASFAGETLPGVRNDDKLFEIKRKSGLDDDADMDLNENDGAYRVASAAGLARLAPNGLLTQREGVDVACLKPALVRVLKKIERHYGKPVVVTSGYRSAAYNRRARGARNSLHIYCAAADIQVENVSKWDLARYLRSMPGRGGVGTYCHTKSVHVDVGPERDWNWRCRRRKRRS